jgi:hypothetical protein
MINTAKLATFLSAYKAQFTDNWPNERFKWQAVQHFLQSQLHELSLPSKRCHVCSAAMA